MTEEEKVNVVEAAMSENPPETPEVISVAWEDFLKVCAERGIEFVEGKTVFQMREDFLGNLDKVVPDSEEEAALSDMLVDIQGALVDGAPIVGSPEDANPKGVKKTKVKKEKVKKEKVAKEPKPKKEKVKREGPPKLGGVGMKPMCRELFGKMNMGQVQAAEAEIKEKLAQVYVKEGKGDHAYGLKRADRIYYDIYVEFFTDPPERKVSKAVPKKEKKAEKEAIVEPTPEAEPAEAAPEEVAPEAKSE